MKFPMPDLSAIVDIAKKNMKMIAIAAVAGLLLWYLSTRKTVQGFISGTGAGGANAGTFTLVYADWCPHCKAIAPDVEKAKGPMEIGGKTFMIDAIESANESKIKSLGKEIKGFPTMLFTDSNGSTEEVNVDRSMDAIKAFLAGK